MRSERAMALSAWGTPCEEQVMLTIEDVCKSGEPADSETA